MKIVVDPGSYDFLNVGDVAMMEIALARLSSLWPKASIWVFTKNPSQLKRRFPGVEPLDGDAKNDFFLGRLWPRLDGKLPAGLVSALKRLEDRGRSSLPGVTGSVRMLRRGRQSEHRSSVTNTLNALRSADLLLVSGSGAINDTFRNLACRLLSTISFAVREGVPVVLMGQGIGPVTDPVLRNAASRILPFVDRIAVREGRTSVPLLQEFGVPASKVVVTGDDAIEASYTQRCAELGSGIGVSLRSAKYAGVESAVAKIRAILAECIQQLESFPVSLPISLHPEDGDLAASTLDPDASRIFANGTEWTPLRVIEQVTLCRVVVTTTYHAAVFALSQGIPVVAIASSAYYTAKFSGLAEQFPDGCTVVDLRQRSSLDELRREIDNGWRCAPEIRPRLLNAARQQINAGITAYAYLKESLGSPALGEVSTATKA